MERTTIFVDSDLLRQARRRARQEGKSFAAVVREALAAYVSGTAHAGGQLPSVTGRFASGASDTSERVDELLWTEPHG
ncbi:MAG TPA: ribbon-helix-helix protein, CopG family [Gemmatimonadaceae bacterium]|nr:ribbon-helix-helix protein, CopG family [Gemmatimonadaceae bacterium]